MLHCRMKHATCSKHTPTTFLISARKHFRTVVGGVKSALKKGMIMSVMAECITADDIAWIDSIGGETVLLSQQDLTLGKVA